MTTAAQDPAIAQASTTFQRGSRALRLISCHSIRRSGTRACPLGRAGRRGRPPGEPPDPVPTAPPGKCRSSRGSRSPSLLLMTAVHTPDAAVLAGEAAPGVEPVEARGGQVALLVVLLLVLLQDVAGERQPGDGLHRDREPLGVDADVLQQGPQSLPVLGTAGAPVLAGVAEERALVRARLLADRLTRARRAFGSVGLRAALDQDLAVAAPVRLLAQPRGILDRRAHKGRHTAQEALGLTVGQPE